MRRVRVAGPDHVWFRSIVESYEGLATWRTEGDGVFELIAPDGREVELDGLLADLSREGSIEIL